MKWRYPASVYKEVIRVSWPLIVSQGSFTAMLFFDRVFLANFSDVAIQAALPAGIFSFTLVSGFMSVAAYTNTFVAQFFGAKNFTECSRSTAQGVLFSLFTAPLLLLLIFPGRWLLLHCGHADAVMEAELPYFTILMLGSVATPLNAAISSYFNGQGRTRLTMVIAVVGNGVNLLLDYIFIFGKFGFPVMGIRGAAWATVISGFISPLVLLMIYFTKKEHDHFQTRSTFAYHHRLFWRMIRFALPSGIHLALEIASFSLFVLLTGRMDPVSLSASNIALSINTLSFMPLIGISIATSILVGQHQGKNNSQGAANSAHAALHLGILYMTCMSILFMLQPEALISLFVGKGPDCIPLKQILPIGQQLLIILAIWGFSDAFNLVYSSALKGAGDTRFVMFFSVLSAWLILVPGQFVLIEILKVDIVKAWCWTGFYITVLASGFVWRFMRNRWRDIDVMGHPNH